MDPRPIKIPPQAGTSPQRPSYLGAPAGQPLVMGVLAKAPQYFYLSPDMARGELRPGPAPANLTARKAPGFWAPIYTPTNTYLFVDPEGGVYAPKLAWTPIAPGLKYFGQYLGSALFAPEEFDINKLDDKTYATLFGKAKSLAANGGFPLSAAQTATLLNLANGGKPAPGSTFLFPVAKGVKINASGPAFKIDPAQIAALNAASQQGAGGSQGGAPQSGSSEGDILPPPLQPAKDEGTSGATIALGVVVLGAVGLGIYAATRR